MRVFQDFIGGELTADHTNVVTTMTSDALEAVVDIAGDEFMYVTLDPDGVAGEPEIVKITAHTASVPSATIERGALGTIARAHKSGIEWTAPVVTEDMKQIDAASSKVDNPVLFAAVYGEDEGFDEEFGRISETTIPSSGTWVNQETSTYVEQFGVGSILTEAKDADFDWRLIAFDLPVASSWTLWGKLTPMLVDTADRAGIGIRDSGTGELLFLQWYSGVSPDVYVTRFDTANTFNSNVYGPTNNERARSVYFRITKNSASDYDFAYSMDGVGWRTVVTAHDASAYMTPDQFWFGGHTSTPLPISCEWLRVRT